MFLLVSLTSYQENPHTNLGVPKCIAIQDGQHQNGHVNYYGLVVWWLN